MRFMDPPVSIASIDYSRLPVRFVPPLRGTEQRIRVAERGVSSLWTVGAKRLRDGHRQCGNRSPAVRQTRVEYPARREMRIAQGVLHRAHDTAAAILAGEKRAPLFGI